MQRAKEASALRPDQSVPRPPPLQSVESTASHWLLQRPTITFVLIDPREDVTPRRSGARADAAGRHAGPRSHVGTTAPPPPPSHSSTPELVMGTLLGGPPRVGDDDRPARGRGALRCRIGEPRQVPRRLPRGAGKAATPAASASPSTPPRRLGPAASCPAARFGLGAGEEDVTPREPCGDLARHGDEREGKPARRVHAGAPRRSRAAGMASETAPRSQRSLHPRRPGRRRAGRGRRRHRRRAPRSARRRGPHAKPRTAPKKGADAAGHCAAAVRDRARPGRDRPRRSGGCPHGPRLGAPRSPRAPRRPRFASPRACRTPPSAHLRRLRLFATATAPTRLCRPRRRATRASTATASVRPRRAALRQRPRSGRPRSKPAAPLLREGGRASGRGCSAVDT